MAWKTSWAISVDGRDASDAMNDFLISIEVEEKEGGAGDTASLELDDTAGRNILPRAGARVVITLGDVQKFDGWTEEPEWSYARGGGRKISVNCVSHDSRGPVKDGQRWHQDGGTLQQFLARAAKEAGLAAIKVAPAFASITRPWWSLDGASLLHGGQRLAAELGAIFKIRGDTAVFAERGSGASASGAAIAPVVFDCLDAGVTSVKAKPFTGRESRTKAKATWFDRAAGKWQTEEVEIAGLDGAPASVAHPRFPRADAEGAKAGAKGRKDAAKHDKGSASVECDLRVEVPIGAPATLKNARPGVDGAWKVKTAKHKLDRGGGGKSTFELARPDGDVGTDKRKTSLAAPASRVSGVQEAGAAPSNPVA